MAKYVGILSDLKSSIDYAGHYKNCNWAVECSCGYNEWRKRMNERINRMERTDKALALLEAKEAAEKK